MVGLPILPITKEFEQKSQISIPCQLIGLAFCHVSLDYLIYYYTCNMYYGLQCMMIIWYKSEYTFWECSIQIYRRYLGFIGYTKQWLWVCIQHAPENCLTIPCIIQNILISTSNRIIVYLIYINSANKYFPFYISF